MIDITEESHTLILGDCLEVLRTLESDSLDSLVTDPPAGISFMGKGWDSDKGGRDQWIAWMTEVMGECLRVLKPGAHGLVWALPRTSHWTATALENAGFEVRDVVTHLFGTGFPKSLDISKAIDKAAGAEREVIGKGQAGKSSIGQVTRVGLGARPTIRDGSDFNVTAPATDSAKQWQGWGTALKPASEHWILVRKPCSEKTVAANVLKHGTGGINIDGCRIDSKPRTTHAIGNIQGTSPQPMSWGEGTRHAVQGAEGRFPANLVLDEEAAAMLDEQSGNCASKSGRPGRGVSNVDAVTGFDARKPVGREYGDSGGASRFFYVAKASKSDRGEANTHPTVKSTKLMEYLIKLVTPPGGTILDPFMGSGSTGVVTLNTDYRFIGIEKDNEYFKFANRRLKENSISERAS